MNVDPFHLITLIATFFWVYAVLIGTRWAAQFIGAPADGDRRPALLFNLAQYGAPVLVALLIVVGLGYILDVPRAYRVANLILSGGLVFAFSSSMNDIRPANWREESFRLAVALAVSGFLAWQTGQI